MPAPTVDCDATFNALATTLRAAFCDPRAHKVLKENWHSTHAPLATRNAQRKTSWPKVKFAATKRRRNRRATKCQARVRRPPRVDCHQLNCRAVRASFSLRYYVVCMRPKIFRSCAMHVSSLRVWLHKYARALAAISAPPAMRM